MGWMALIDQNLNEICIVGDEPWDIMGEAIAKIKECYQKDWHRDPTDVELVSIFEFAFEPSSPSPSST